MLSICSFSSISNISFSPYKKTPLQSRCFLCVCFLSSHTHLFSIQTKHMIYFAGKKEGRTKGEDEPRPKNIFLAFLRKGFSWFLPRVCPHTDIFLSREMPYADQRKSRSTEGFMISIPTRKAKKTETLSPMGECVLTSNITSRGGKSFLFTVL